MSEVRFGQDLSLKLGVNIQASGTGKPVITYKPSTEFSPPVGYVERMEWIRKSYERFLAKVLEKEALVGGPPVDIS